MCFVCVCVCARRQKRSSLCRDDGIRRDEIERQSREVNSYRPRKKALRQICIIVPVQRIHYTHICLHAFVMFTKTSHFFRTKKSFIISRDSDSKRVSILCAFEFIFMRTRQVRHGCALCAAHLCMCVSAYKSYGLLFGRSSHLVDTTTQSIIFLSVAVWAKPVQPMVSLFPFVYVLLPNEHNIIARTDSYKFSVHNAGELTIGPISCLCVCGYPIPRISFLSIFAYLSLKCMTPACSINYASHRKFIFWM